jgi:hypothetical protein
MQAHHLLFKRVEVDQLGREADHFGHPSANLRSIYRASSLFDKICACFPGWICSPISAVLTRYPEHSLISGIRIVSADATSTALVRSSCDGPSCVWHHPVCVGDRRVA